jgi:transmembrane sensor
MNKSRLAFLFQAYVHKTATPAEREELMALLEQGENDELVKELLTSSWEQHTGQRQPFNEGQGQEMLSTILQKGRVMKPAIVVAKSASHRWWRVAAAAAIFLFVFAGGYFWLKSNRPEHLLTKNALPGRQTIVPGGNKAVLTLADGSKIVLDSTQQGVLTKQGDAQVVNSTTAVLAYDGGSSHGRETIYNTLSTPKGGQYQLLLSDGTKVWLNASSSISYPVTFQGKERNVSITGEAYFEVAKNAAMPFTVTVKDATVRVLGTHFNIMAYDDENMMNTTVLEGSVKVSKGPQAKILAPGQQLKATPAGTLKVEEADVEEVMAWKNGFFQFKSADIEKIMRQVARWYDVDVVTYEGKIPTGHFSAILERKNNIAQVLKIMEGDGVHFRITGRTIVVANNQR